MGPQDELRVGSTGRQSRHQCLDISANSARAFPHIPAVDRKAHSGFRERVHVTFLSLTELSQPERSGASQKDQSPSAESIELDIIDILKRVSRRPVEPTATSELLADLGLDSLQVLELVGELEDHFNIAVPLNTLTHIRTVRDIAAEVHRLTSAGDAPA